MLSFQDKLRDKISICFRSEKFFTRNVPYLIERVKKSDKSYIEQILGALQIFLGAEASALQKGCALLFLKECLDTGSKVLIKAVEKGQALQALKEIAVSLYYEKANENPFSVPNKISQTEQNKQLYLMVLECLDTWRKFSSENEHQGELSGFYKICEDLNRLGIVFQRQYAFEDDGSFTSGGAADDETEPTVSGNFWPRKLMSKTQQEQFFSSNNNKSIADFSLSQILSEQEESKTGESASKQNRASMNSGAKKNAIDDLPDYKDEEEDEEVNSQNFDSFSKQPKENIDFWGIDQGANMDTKMDKLNDPFMDWIEKKFVEDDQGNNFNGNQKMEEKWGFEPPKESKDMFADFGFGSKEFRSDKKEAIDLFNDFGNGKFDDAFDKFAEGKSAANDFPEWSAQKAPQNLDMDNLFSSSPLKKEEMKSDATAAAAAQSSIKLESAKQELSVENKIHEDMFNELPSLDKASEGSMRNSMDYLDNNVEQEGSNKMKESGKQEAGMIDWMNLEQEKKLMEVNFLNPNILQQNNNLLDLSGEVPKEYIFPQNASLEQVPKKSNKQDIDQQQENISLKKFLDEMKQQGQSKTNSNSKQAINESKQDFNLSAFGSMNDEHSEINKTNGENSVLFFYEQNALNNKIAGLNAAPQNQVARGGGEIDERTREKIETMADEIEGLAHDIADLKAEKANVRKEYVLALESIKDERDSCQKQGRNLMQNIEELEEKLNLMRKANDNTKKEDRSSLETAKQSVFNLQLDYENLKQELLSFKISSENQAVLLKTDLEKHQRDFEKLKSETKGSSSSSPQIVGSVELVRIEAQQRLFSEESERIKASISQIKRDLTQLDTLTSGTNSAIEALKISQKEDYAYFKRTMEGVEGNFKNQVKLGEESVSKVLNVISSLQSELHEMSEREVKDNKEREMKIFDIGQKLSENNVKIAKISEFEISLEGLVREIKELKDENTNLKSKLSKLDRIESQQDDLSNKLKEIKIEKEIPLAQPPLLSPSFSNSSSQYQSLKERVDYFERSSREAAENTTRQIDNALQKMEKSQLQANNQFVNETIAEREAQIKSWVAMILSSELEKAKNQINSENKRAFENFLSKGDAPGIMNEVKEHIAQARTGILRETKDLTEGLRLESNKNGEKLKGLEEDFNKEIVNLKREIVEANCEIQVKMRNFDSLSLSKEENLLQSNILQAQKQSPIKQNYNYNQNLTPRANEKYEISSNINIKSAIQPPNGYPPNKFLNEQQKELSPVRNEDDRGILNVTSMLNESDLSMPGRQVGDQAMKLQALREDLSKLKRECESVKNNFTSTYGPVKPGLIEKTPAVSPLKNTLHKRDRSFTNDATPKNIEPSQMRLPTEMIMAAGYSSINPVHANDIRSNLEDKYPHTPSSVGSVYMSNNNEKLVALLGGEKDFRSPNPHQRSGGFESELTSRSSPVFAGLGKSKDKRKGNRIEVISNLKNEFALSILQTTVGGIKMNMDKFKICCLNSNGVLYENHEILIRVRKQSNIRLRKANQIDTYQFSLSFSNKLQTPMRGFSVSSMKGSDDVTTDPKELREETLHGLSNLIQDYFVSEKVQINDSRLPVLMIKYSTTSKSENVFRIPLPCTLNKFCDFTFIDAMSFKSKWNSIGCENTMFSKPLAINKGVLENIQDLKVFLPGLIDLNIVKKPGTYSPYSQKQNVDFEVKKARMGAIFSFLGSEEKFLLKVTVSYDEKLQFYIGRENLRKNADILRLAELFIHTFTLIFCELL